MDKTNRENSKQEEEVHTSKQYTRVQIMKG